MCIDIWWVCYCCILMVIYSMLYTDCKMDSIFQEHGILVTCVWHMEIIGEYRTDIIFSIGTDGIRMYVALYQRYLIANTDKYIGSASYQLCSY